MSFSWIFVIFKICKINWHRLYVWIRSATFINYLLNVFLNTKEPGVWSGILTRGPGEGHICPHFKIPVSGYEIHIYEYGTCYIPRNSFKLLWETSILSWWTWSKAKMTYHCKKIHKRYRATSPFAKHCIWHFSHCVCNISYFRKSTGITNTVFGIWTCRWVNFHFSNAAFKYFLQSTSVIKKIVYCVVHVAMSATCLQIGIIRLVNLPISGHSLAALDTPYSGEIKGIFHWVSIINAWRR